MLASRSESPVSKVMAVTSRDYYDLFLIDSDANIVYTVFKEDDLGTNLLTGPFSGSSIAEVYRRAVNSAPESVVASGFEQ